MRIPRDLFPLLLYAGASVALFGDSFRPSRSFFPFHSDELPPWSAHADPARAARLRETSVYGLTDKAWMFHPPLVDAGRAIGEGELPLWNPRAFGGFPQHAVQLTGLFYPPNLPLLLGDPLRAYGFLAAFHAFAASALTYAFLRRIGSGRPGATLGGFAFGFGGWHLLRAHYFMIAGAGTWLPLVLLALESLARGGTRRWIVAGAAGVAFSFLAGFPQVAILSCEIAAAFALYRLLGLRKAEGAARPGAFAASAAAVFAIGGCLAAAQLLPGAEFARHSARAPATAQVLQDQALAPGHFGAFLVPDLFGDPVHGKGATPDETVAPLLARLLVPPVRDPFNPFETTAFFGILPLLAAFLGFRRRGPAGFFALAAVALALLSLRGPFVSLGHALLPGFRLGAPSRNLFGIAFCGAVLAGLGLDALVSRPLPKVRAALAVGLLLASGWAAGILSLDDAPSAGAKLFASRAALARASALTGVSVTREEALARTSPEELATNANLARNQAARLFLFLGAAFVALRWGGRFRGALAVALAAADLGSFGWPLTRAVPREGLLEPPSLVAPAVEGREEGRVFRVGDPKLLPPQLLSLYELEDAGGYMPSLASFESFLSAIDPGAPFGGVGGSAVAGLSLPSSPLFPLLGARWLLAPLDAARSWPADRAAIAFADEASGHALVRLRDALPRAFVVSRVRRETDEASARARLLAPGFDPRAEVVAIDPSRGGAAEERGEGFHAAQVVERSANRVVVRSPARGWLVLLESWYPGWEARVNGEERTLLRADLHFRAVEVDAGETVEFVFRPRSFRLGLAVSAAALVASAILLLVPGRAPAGRNG